MEYFGDIKSCIKFHEENHVKPGSEEYLTE